MKKPAADNPYLNGRLEWNERYGSYIKLAHQWRMAALISGVGLIIAVSLLGAVSLQHKVVPYAVELNEHSEIVRVTRADEMATPTTNQTRASLRNLIIGARTVYGDRRAQENQIKVAYAMILPDSAAFQALTTFHNENNPYLRSQKETVEVAVNSVLLIDGNTWKVEWTETTKMLSGRVLESKVWQGSFTVVIVPPADDGQILVNPLGVYVKSFSWAIRQL